MVLAKFNTIEISKSVASTVNWQYNQAGYTYNQVGLEYGGADQRQGPYPQTLIITDQYGPQMERTIVDQYGPPQMEVILE